MNSNSLIKFLAWLAEYIIAGGIFYVAAVVSIFNKDVGLESIDHWIFTLIILVGVILFSLFNHRFLYKLISINRLILIEILLVISLLMLFLNHNCAFFGHL